MNFILNSNRYQSSVISIINISKSNISIIILSVLYAGILANLPLMEFFDRNNYLLYTQDSLAILESHWSRGFFSFLSNEPAWLAINIVLSSFLSSETTLKCIIFFSSLFFALVISKYKPRELIWFCLVLIVPTVINKYTVHLRQGLAIDFFLFGCFAHNKVLKRISFTIAPFIHSSFFIVYALMIINKIITWLKLSMGLRFLIIFIVAIIIGLYLYSIAFYFGARQGQVDFQIASNTSGVGFSFWFIILGVMCLEGRLFIGQHDLELSTIVFYLSTYYFSVSTVNVFESSVVLVFLSMQRLTGWRRIICMLLLGFFTIFSYMYRTFWALDAI
jgi:hypothetical protein